MLHGKHAEGTVPISGLGFPVCWKVHGGHHTSCNSSVGPALLHLGSDEAGGLTLHVLAGVNTCSGI